MLVVRVAREALAGRTTTLSTRFLPRPGEADTPFTSYIVDVPPGGSTTAHDHHDSEVWLILSGRGLVTSDGERADVGVGDAIFLPPLSHHALQNLSRSESLRFVTLYWEDMARFDAEAASRAPTGWTPPAPRVLVLPSFPTPNGDLHVGHLSGPYVGADIYARYLRLRGVEARLLLGTVGHQSQVRYKGQQMGLSFYETAEHFSAEIVETLRAAAIEPDVFIRPMTARYYVSAAQEHCRVLYDAGHLIPKDDPVHYCDHCGQFLFEAYVRGTCPYCGSDDASGNECEACARHHEDVALRDPVCTRCGARPRLRDLSRLHVPLERFRDVLSEYHRTVAMSPRLRAFCARVLADPLPDIPISYITDSGVPLPIPGFDDQRLYSSFELVPRYLASVRELAERVQPEADWTEFCRAEQAATVLFFGFDNAYLRAIVFPALLSASAPWIRLPVAMIVNEFYTLEGFKFSTGRDHAIWGRDLIGRSSADTVRYYLSVTRPEHERTDFTLDAFGRAVRRDLIESWEAWLRELAGRLHTASGDLAPEAGPWSERTMRFYRHLRRTVTEVGQVYDADAFSPQRATRLLCDLVHAARAFGNAGADLAGLDGFRNELRTCLALELMAVRTLAMLTAPVMPGFAEALWRNLGYESPLSVQRWEDVPEWVPPGQQVGGLDAPYFS